MKYAPLALFLWVSPACGPQEADSPPIDLPPIAEQAPGPCGALDHRGACRGDIAVWCEDGVERRVDCTLVDKRCGWVDDEQGFYCGGDPEVTGPAELDGPVSGCGDIGVAGVCQDTSLLWCAGDSLRRLDCAAAGARCAYLAAEDAYACVPDDGAPAPPEPDPDPGAPPPPEDDPPGAPPTEPPEDPPADPNDPCGGLDYLGECRGTTAHWCEDGVPRSRECGAQGCGWVNGETGYYCGGVGEGPEGGGPPPNDPPNDPPPDPPADPPPADPPVGDACGSPEEQETVRLANATRQQSGLRPLDCDPLMLQAARDHSQDMCDNNYFSHTGRDGSQPWDRMRRAGARFSTAGENIAWGYQTPDAVHTGWMNSAGHRRNIMGNGWGRVAVGYANCGGSHYWTQVFAD